MQISLITWKTHSLVSPLLWLSSMKKQMIRSKYGKIVLNSAEDRDIDNGCHKYLETKKRK